MNVFELFIDDEDFKDGIHAISLVSDPAIESDWVTLSKDKKEVKLAVVNEEKKILMGAALIPDKKIYRRIGDDEFEIFFSKETVRKASELFFKSNNQSETTLEHQIDLQGNTVVESWIKEDEVNDKSAKYGIDAPIGSWIISMKIENDEVYKMAKDGLISGFSIEGYFSDKAILSSKHSEELELLDEILQILKNTTKN